MQIRDDINFLNGLAGCENTSDVQYKVDRLRK